MRVESVSNTFEASIKPQKNKKKKVLYGAAAAAIIAAGVTASIILAGRKKPDKYLVELAQCLSKELNKTVKPSELDSVMTKEEFLREIPKLKEENFVASVENIKNGTFIADLHSHSNFSDGRLSVQEIMEQTANYGDKINSINGKKFIFAITDHDGVGGVKEALKIIAENPEKFKNVKFVPAAELSFIESCSFDSVRFGKYHSDVQMPEMLIYNLNPFSENTEKYFSNLYGNRKKLTQNMIDRANNDFGGYNFSLQEFEQFADKSQGKYCLLNHHWNVHDYLQLKTRLVDIAREQKKDEKQFFEETIQALADARRTPNGLSKYLKERNIETTTPETYDRVTNLSREFFPKNENGIAKSAYENTFDDIANFALKEHSYLAFAHPGFTMQNFSEGECYSKMRSYIMRSKGTLRFVEKFHQAYPFGTNIEREELGKYHKILDEFNLFNLGGRDNHSNNFTDFK